jgi:hypothetical protein
MRRFLCLVAIFLLFAGIAVAQSPNATVTGRVLDPNGAIVVGAKIEITNSETGVQSASETNGEGIYTISGLRPGIYRIEVAKPGFKTLLKPDIVLHVQDIAAINFSLPLGSVSETVTVSVGGVNINTTDASVGTVVDRKFVENIPLNGRSFQDLISMTPGVVTQSPQSSSSIGLQGDFSVNGQRTESNYYMVDGVAGNVSPGNGFGTPGPANGGTVPGSTALGTTQSLVSVEALQEFRVQSSTYSAEYGRTPGGQFSLLTRSGTNDLHGSAFDYVRNSFFDANDWFNDKYGKPISALRQNDFGGTLGGPVAIPGLYDGKDKTFFFVSYEGLHLTQPQGAGVQYVPDMSLRQNAPEALQPILNAYPLPSPGGIDYGNLAQFIEPYSLPSTINSTSVRLDHSFGPKLSLFFRFGDTPSSTETRYLSVLSRQSVNTQTYTLGATSQFSSRSSNEFRIGYTRADAFNVGSIDTFGGATPINLVSALAGSSYPTGEADFYIYIPGVGSSELFVGNTGNRTRQWNATDTFSLSSGHHTMKFGLDYRRIESPVLAPSPYIAGIFESTQSILNNNANDLVLEKNVSSAPIFNETSAFVQDEWRVTSKLNVSFGVRWEVDPPPTGAHGQDAYTLSGDLSNPSSLALAPQGTPLWKTTWYNFAPRLGVAWQARNRPGWDTVLRAGGGVFFDTDNEAASYGFEGIGFRADKVLSNVPVPATAAQLQFSPSTTPPYSTIYAFPHDLQLPYSFQWNTSVEQAMGRSQSLTISYVGSAGRRLIQLQELSLGALNPNFGSVIVFPNGVTSNYQALQLQFQRSVSHGVQVLSSYTWSHSIDFGSNDLALPLTRGNSDFDLRHNFQGGLAWDLPTVRQGGLAKAILGHWGLDARVMARSGFPVTLQGNLIVDPETGQSYNGNVNLVPGQAIHLFGAQYPGGRAINPAAFSIPPGNDPGDAPRNFVRGFGIWQINMAVRREFPIREGLHLQFRAEAFNILNHPNFGYVDPTLGDATFGQATQMLNQSLGTVAPQYQQGGPRSLQFALKLAF